MNISAANMDINPYKEDYKKDLESKYTPKEFKFNDNHVPCNTYNKETSILYKQMFIDVNNIHNIDEVLIKYHAKNMIYKIMQEIIENKKKIKNSHDMNEILYLFDIMKHTKKDLPLKNLYYLLTLEYNSGSYILNKNNIPCILYILNETYVTNILDINYYEIVILEINNNKNIIANNNKNNNENSKNTNVLELNKLTNENNNKNIIANSNENNNNNNKNTDVLDKLTNELNQLKIKIINIEKYNNELEKKYNNLLTLATDTNHNLTQIIKNNNNLT